MRTLEFGLYAVFSPLAVVVRLKMSNDLVSCRITLVDGSFVDQSIDFFSPALAVLITASSLNGKLCSRRGQFDLFRPKDQADVRGLWFSSSSFVHPSYNMRKPADFM